MKKINSHCWLAIASALCIIVCLGYVTLFQDLTAKIKDPNHSQYWQLQTVALQFRDAKSEAKEAFLEGNYRPFDSKTLVPTTAHWTAESYKAIEGKQKSTPTRFASFQSAAPAEGNDHASLVTTSHMAFQKTVHDFVLEYNSELARLMNSQRN